MPKFSRLEKIITSDNVNKLKTKSVLILGCGGVGGYVAEALARSNIGTLILVDFDVIEESNINRQIIALDSTIGQKKVFAFEKRIKDINKNCQVIKIDSFITKENIQTLFNYSIDFFIDACDSIEAKQLVITNCLKRKIPFIICTGTGNRIDPSKLEITTLQNTSYDPLARLLRKYVKDNHINNKIIVLASTEHPLKIKDRTPGSTAFVPASAGLLIASYVVRKIIGDKND